MTDQPLKPIIEAALFVAGKPLAIDQLLELFAENEQPERSAIRTILRELQEDYAERGVELVQVASGYRFQTKPNLTPWLKRLQGERSARYSRALLETIAIIAYRQPITRTEIEAIRGISVSTDLIKRLQDYNWIRVLAHKDTPGRPALYGTTSAFLDYFNLKKLSELPTLIELREMVNEQTAKFDSEAEKDEKGKEHDAEKDSDVQVLESKDNGINLTVPDVPESEEQTDSNAQVLESKDNKINLTVPDVPKSEEQTDSNAQVLESQDNKINLTTPKIPESEEQTDSNAQVLEFKDNENNLTVPKVPESEEQTDSNAQVLESKDNEINLTTPKIPKSEEQTDSNAQVLESKDNKINLIVPYVPASEKKNTNGAATNGLDSEENQISGVHESENRNINSTPEILESEANQLNLAVLEVPEPENKNNNRVADVLESEDSKIDTPTKALESENEQSYTTPDMFDSKK